MIALGCDHGGLILKQAIKEFLSKEGILYKDFGTFTKQSVDYPRYALDVANAVVNKYCEYGILCCGTGIGISIAANKVKGIRAAVCHSEFTAEMARRHNNANILCLGGRVLDAEKAVLLVKIFLKTPFDGGRHKNRLDQILKIENKEYNF